MKSKSLVVLLLLLVAVIFVAEASIFVKTSLLREKRGIFDECFTCKQDERPFYYPLVKYFNKMKDAFVKGFSEIAASAKEYSKKLT